MATEMDVDEINSELTASAERLEASLSREVTRLDRLREARDLLSNFIGGGCVDSQLMDRINALISEPTP